jgi:drug/metabolite transporter (DMT)-like permease
VLIFALAAAALYGSADFLGGMAARRASPFAVIAVTMPAGAAVVLTVMLACAAAGDPKLAAFGGWGAAAWAAAGGVAGATGLIAFYAGFASAPMSVVAPVSALVSTVVPVGAALAGGERPSALVIVGAVVCVAAIVLVSAEPGGTGGQTLRGVGYGIAAGAAFGLFFLFLKNAGHAAVFGPVAVQRLTGTMLAFGVLAVTRPRPLWRGPVAGAVDRGLLCIALLSGAVDAIANISYVLATRAGQFGLAVVITSLYPGATVLLARLVLQERMRTLQRIGLLLAAAGIVLVTA